MIYGRLAFYAVIQDNLDALRKLLNKQADMTFLNAENHTLVQFAGYKDKWECIQLIIAFDYIEPMSARFASALCNAAKAQNWGMVDILTPYADSGAVQYANLENGYSALHWTIEDNNMPALEKLLIANADPNCWNGGKISPIELAE